MSATTELGRTAQIPYTTRIGIDEGARRQLVALLNQTLADAFDLFSQTKQAHWNVKGQAFYPLHLLYDELAEKLEEPADLIAERVVLLGGYAFGTVRMAAQSSRIDPFPSAGEAGAPSYLNALADRWAQFSQNVRADHAMSEEIGDPGTTDLYDQLTHIADRGLWFIEGHLQRYSGGLENGGADPQ